MRQSLYILAIFNLTRLKGNSHDKRLTHETWNTQFSQSLIYIIWHAGLSMNILHTGNKSPMQERFSKNSVSDLLPALRFLGRLYNFCNFVIILSLMQVTICKRVTYFTDSEMIEYYQKTCGWNSKSPKTKNYVTNYARTLC